jgi:PAS domain S-box-containing protein
MEAANSQELDARFRELKRYVRFSEDDAQRLARFRPRAEPHFHEIVQLFYERVREHEDAFAVFGSEEALARMHGLLVAWLGRILTGPYDAAYAAKSCHIGQVHVRVGLPQRFMFTAMSVFRQRLHALAGTLGDDPDLALALDRILDLELALMNDAYQEAMAGRMQRLAREARERARGSAQEVATRYEHAFMMAGCITVALDAKGRALLVNRQAAAVADVEPAEVAGEPFGDLIAEERERFQQALTTVFATQERVKVPLSLSIRTRAGRIRRVEGVLARDPEENRGEPMAIFTGQDVTDQEALLARVRQAERLAAVGTLAAGLAHEIRNPLNGAQLHITYIERALRRRGGEDDLEEAIGVVSGEIARLSALVNEFLDFARPARPETKPCDVKPLCRHAAVITKNETGVKIDLELPQSPLVAQIDPHKIEQVILNLVRNAVEACETSDGRVRIRAYREPRFAVIEVHDDGPGFQAEAPIFDAFFSTKAQGTGMGLAIAHRIVDDHGGSIEAQSRPGDTMFRVRLPAVEQATD